jgi:glycosyltransferase involved in cell wall biosynthesis
MKVSIIIPTYNYGGFISETMKCIAMQTHRNFECLIIDDGSTDNTAEIVSEQCNKDKRFIYIRQENGGASRARNTGIKNATGEYIQFLDSDDLLVPTKIEYQLDIFKKNIDVDIVYGRYIYFSDDSKDIFEVSGKDDTWTPKISGNGRDIITSFFDTNIGMTHALLIKKQIINKAGYFDETFKIFEDWKYWATCALLNANFYYDDSDKAVVFVRRGHTSLQSDKKSTERDYIKLQQWMLNAIVQSKFPDAIMKSVKQQYVNTRGLRSPDMMILKDPYMRNLLLKKVTKKMTNLFQ